ncbi:MAG: hypothetical protein ACI87O_001319 [Planctomycetota bacterium]|jgi:hypothetical protein
MKRFTPKTLLMAAALVAAIGTYGEAQILRVDLGQMVTSTDGAVFGTITNKETIRIDHPIDGPELYYTTLTIKGTDLATNQPTTVNVSFPGGFIDEERGAFNSEAPAEDVISVGKEVVAFHKWSDNMGGDFASSALFASHGGVYSTFQSKGNVIVQGRGDGYAIPTNTHLARLQGSIQEFQSETR